MTISQPGAARRRASRARRRRSAAAGGTGSVPVDVAGRERAHVAGQPIDAIGHRQPGAERAHDDGVGFARRHRLAVATNSPRSSTASATAPRRRVRSAAPPASAAAGRAAPTACPRHRSPPASPARRRAARRRSRSARAAPPAARSRRRRTSRRRVESSHVASTPGNAKPRTVACRLARADAGRHAHAVGERRRVGDDGAPLDDDARDRRAAASPPAARRWQAPPLGQPGAVPGPHDDLRRRRADHLGAPVAVDVADVERQNVDVADGHAARLPAPGRRRDGRQIGAQLGIERRSTYRCARVSVGAPTATRPAPSPLPVARSRPPATSRSSRSSRSKPAARAQAASPSPRATERTPERAQARHDQRRQVVAEPRPRPGDRDRDVQIARGRQVRPRALDDGVGERVERPTRAAPRRPGARAQDEQMRRGTVASYANCRLITLA